MSKIYSSDAGFNVRREFKGAHCSIEVREVMLGLVFDKLGLSFSRVTCCTFTRIYCFFYLIHYHIALVKFLIIFSSAFCAQPKCQYSRQPAPQKT